MMDKLVKMARLEAKATKGPWTFETASCGVVDHEERLANGSVLQTTHRERWMCGLFGPDRRGVARSSDRVLDGEVLRPNADQVFIAEARAFVPWAIAEIRQLRDAL